MKRILVGGIGNIFEGDDAFGVEVIRRLSARALPLEVELFDFGICGVDLAYALGEGYNMAVLVDAAQRGEAPGTISVVEPHDLPSSHNVAMEAHNLDPATVLRLASGCKEACGKIVLVLCEPETLGGEEGLLGLTRTVSAAVESAVEVVEHLVESFLHTEGSNSSAAEAAFSCKIERNMQ